MARSVPSLVHDTTPPSTRPAAGHGPADRLLAVPTRWLVLGGLALALGLRLLLIALTPHLALTNDPADYARHAVSIAAGHGYPPSHQVPGGGPTAIRPPAFPYLLGAFYALSGDSLLAGRILEALLGTLACGLIGLVAGLLFGRTAGLLALLLAAVYPPLIVGGASLLSEPLFIVLALGAVAAVLVQLRRGAGARWVALAGVLGGLAFLTRTTAPAVILPLLVAVRGRPLRPLRRGLAMPALLLACAVVTVAPWTIRNAVDFHAFVPVSDEDGYTLIGTYNQASFADRQFPAAWRAANLGPAVERLVARSRGLDEVQLDGRLRSAALHFAGQHPMYVLSASWHNLLRVYDLDGQTYHRLATRAEVDLGAHWSELERIGFWVFGLLAVAGVASGAARRAPPWLWSIPVLLTLVVIPAAGEQRLRLPIDPFVVILATLGAMAIARRLERRRRRIPALGHAQ